MPDYGGNPAGRESKALFAPFIDCDTIIAHGFLTFHSLKVLFPSEPVGRLRQSNQSEAARANDSMPARLPTRWGKKKWIPRSREKGDGSVLKEVWCLLLTCGPIEKSAGYIKYDLVEIKMCIPKVPYYGDLLQDIVKAIENIKK